MSDNRDEIKTDIQYLVFIRFESITTWLPDPDFPDSLHRFLDDCRANGWPVLVAGAHAYVFCAGER